MSKLNYTSSDQLQKLLQKQFEQVCQIPYKDMANDRSNEQLLEEFHSFIFDDSEIFNKIYIENKLNEEGDLTELGKMYENNLFINPELATWKVIEHEPHFDDIETFVYKITLYSGVVFYMGVTIRYSSYDGYYFDRSIDVDLVQPVTKEIIVYESVKS